MDTTSLLRKNLESIQERIRAAAERVGRSPDEVRLVAVTKYVDVPVVRQLVELGQRSLGESRPQQLWQRHALLADLPIQWHLVGPLQRNKVRKTLPCVEWIHSVDSLSLLADINRIAGELGLRPKLLLEVNISRHPSKHGFAPEMMEEIISQLGNFPNVTICGLMAMAGVEGDLEGARRDFRALRQLRDRLSPLAPPQISLTELSMGMSGDFEIAIEEGATMVRIGCALFKGILEEDS
ncbi:YggS [Thermogutta terrifontis]|uniref:Pyridoxal phosphate homeostasis protein n=1 Tax=Thermogutta terrifontis TaxID=1331910 RepID=A0A286RKR5_9BACT|nr:YggS family pyridoxal phosphate-dependent enzyme [Thermogutta terrifontis]ASV76559.1 YggS [Thermogutta terrifontis]